MTVELYDWQPNFRQGKHFSSIILASRNSGKSYLTKHLLRTHLAGLYDRILIVTPSPDDARDYQECTGDEAIIYTQFRSEMITMLFDKNTERKAKGKRMINFLIVLDDTSGSKIKYDDSLFQLFNRGRHMGVSNIFITQNYTAASPSWRDNSDIVILLKQNSATARDAVRDKIMKGTIYLEDGLNEKKVLTKVVHDYMSKRGDAVVITADTEEGDLQMYKYRAP